MDRLLTVTHHDAMVGSCNGYAGGKEDCGVKKRDLKWVKGLDPGRGSEAPELGGWGQAGVVEGSEEA